MALPDDPHTLVATFVFPQRAQLRLERLGARPGERRLQFLCGPHVFAIAAGEGASTVIGPEARELDRLRAELRRVATTWPAELDWVQGEGVRSAELAGLGTLRASGLDPRGRPATLAAHTLAGTELERLESIVWPAAGRWPASWRLAGPDGPIWEEAILEVTTGIGLLDRYFLPPDRLPSLAQGSWDRGAVQEIAIPQRAGRRLPLPAGLAWPVVREWAAERIAEEREQLGSDAHVEDEPAIELDRRGRPVAVWLRGGAAVDGLPEGWERLSGGPARALWLDRPERVDGLLLGELRGRDSEGRRSGVPFLWLRAAGDGEDGQLVVPIGGS